jgi:DNA-directed RNA polymerase subunit RPC12/RpoP
MKSPAASQPWRPERPLRLPLLTGNGFSMSLFMLGAFFSPVVAIAATGVLLLCLGHWLLGPLLTLVGAFFIGAFWSFPRDAWVARPSDVVLDGVGFRIEGGYRDGVSLRWDELDAKASRIRDGASVLLRELVAAKHDGTLVPVAEGDEAGAFEALLDVWRAADGLAPHGTSEPAKAKRKGRATGRKKQTAQDEAAPQSVAVEIVTCGNCGAAARPDDAPTTPCLYCGAAVPLRETLRQRVREFSSHLALKAQSQRLLQQLLEQPRASFTMAPLAVLAAAMLAAWLFGAGVFTLSLLRSTTTIQLVFCALVAPFLFTVLLGLLSSVVVSRRTAVRAVALDFAAVAPPQPGKPSGCRVCGAPLPHTEAALARCAYCNSTNVLASARPRVPTRVKDHAKSLEDTLESQRAEQWVRLIFLVLAGIPALWGAWAALRALWRLRG